ncbi:hypothetical protein GOODEAATRI_005691, partial [Goodea atripinnis]
NPCANQNGGCMHECRVDGGNPFCNCKPGYLLGEDGKTCEDIDECKTEETSCAHGCHNTLGSYTCVCNAAYELGSDGKQCYTLDGAVEALSSRGAIDLPLIRPQLTLLPDYNQPLERYDDYEDDEGELRAESSLAERFGDFPLPAIINSLSLTGNLHLVTWPL